MCAIQSACSLLVMSKQIQWIRCPQHAVEDTTCKQLEGSLERSMRFLGVVSILGR